MEESMKAALSDNMAEIMQSEGPTAQIVILKADGVVKEETFDSTPAKNELSELMGGPVTILGKYHQNGVILLKLRSPQPNSPKNSHPLHAPFAEEEVIGPIALVKMDKDALPVDFTKADFEAFMNLSAEEAAKLEALAIEKVEAELEDAGDLPQEEIDPEILKEMNAAFDEADAAAEEEGEEEDEEEPNPEEVQAAAEDFKTQLLRQVVDFYQQEHGREPTEEETLEAMKDVLRAMSNGNINEAAEEGEEEDEEEAEAEAEEKEVQKENKMEEEEKKPVAEAEKEDQPVEKKMKLTETTSKVNLKRSAEEAEDADQPAKKKIKLTEAEKGEN